MQMSVPHITLIVLTEKLRQNVQNKLRKHSRYRADYTLKSVISLKASVIKFCTVTYTEFNYVAFSETIGFTHLKRKEGAIYTPSIWRRRWDSNPRAPKGKRISSNKVIENLQTWLLTFVLDICKIARRNIERVAYRFAALTVFISRGFNGSPESLKIV